MKRALVVVLVIAALVAAFALGRSDTSDQAKTMQVIDVMPEPTPEVEPQYVAHLWLPSQDENINKLFDTTDLGHTANTKCGYPSIQIGFVFTGQELNDENVSERYPDGVYVDCKTYRLWQSVREFGAEVEALKEEAEATATPAPTASPEVEETVTAPAIATGDPLSFFTHDADAPEGPPSSIGWGPEENGFVVVVGVEIAFAEGNWEIPGSGCEQLLLLSGYMRNASIDDGSFWSYVVDAEVAAADPDTVLEYALLTARTWAFQQAEDEGCQEIVNPDAPLDHTWVGWENEDGTFTFVPYPEFRRSTGENNTTRFFKGDVVYGWHIGEGDSQDDICDGGGCYLNPAPFDGWVGGGIINSTWPGEIPADAVNLAP